MPRAPPWGIIYIQKITMGYRETFSKAQDYDFILRLSEKHRLASISEPLCSLRQSMDSVTSSDAIGEQFQFAVLALVCSIFRCEQGYDPLDRSDKSEFLAR